MKRFNKLFTILMIALLLSIGGFTQAVELVTVLGAKQEEKVISIKSGATTDQIQEALNINENGQYNLIIRVPAGTYELTKELRIYSNTTIQAESDAVFQKVHKRGAMLANDMTKDQGGFSASENITISGGVWDSSAVAEDKKGTESFRFIHAKNITVKNAVICNVPESSHLVTFAGVQNGIVENCVLYGYQGTRPKEAIHLDIVHDDVIVPSMQAEFIKYDDQPCENIQILNNEIYDFPRAIGSHTSVEGVYHSNIVIKNNQIHDILEAGIKAYNYTSSEISGNTIKNVGVGILVYTAIEGEEEHYLTPLPGTVQLPVPENYEIVIKENEITDILVVKEKQITSWGDGIRILGNYERPIPGVQIENNSITRTGRYGIFVEGAPNCQIKKNQLSATTQSGIYLIDGCNGSKISENTVLSPGTTKGRIESNADGIGLQTSDFVDIYENTITEPARNGIFIYDTCQNGTLVQNTITFAGENGIAVYEQSNEMSVTENTIRDSKKHGIFFYKVSSATVNSNEISAKKGTGQDGIHISGELSSKGVFSLKKNKISQSGRFGIYLKQTPGSYISGNQISNTTEHGLYLDQGGDKSKLVWNKVTNAGTKESKAAGIGINHSAKVTINKNTIKNASKNGIFLYNESKNCTVSSNTITAAGENAISVNNKSNSAVISSNTITGTTQKGSKNRGIFIYESDKAKVTKNLIQSCAKKQEIVFSRSIGSTESDNTIK